MPLVLNLTSRDPALMPSGARRIEVRGRFTVGRGADNDLALADPERQLSKNHCVIQFDGRTYTLTDTSTNGVFLNGSPERLMRDAPVALVEGCFLRLGAYEIAVVAIAPDSGFAPSSGRGDPGQYGAGHHDEFGIAPSAGRLDDGLFGDPFASAPVSGPTFGESSRDPFGFDAPAAPNRSDFGPPPSNDDPFGFGGPIGSGPPQGSIIPDDDLFGPAPVNDAWPAQSQHDHAPSPQMAFVPPKASVESIPDDWDLSDLGIENNPGRSQSKPKPDPGFGPRETPVVPAKSTPGGIPDDWDLSDLGVEINPGLSRSKPTADLGFGPAETPIAQPKANVGGIPDDWDLSDSAVESNPRPSRLKPTPDADPRAPSIARSSERQPAPQRPVAPPATPRTGGEAGARAFLAAAGVTLDDANAADAARLLGVAGEMLQAMTKGLMEILAARANTKQEFRIERTMIGAARNNPLKVADTPVQALQILLAAQTPGFTSGSRAVEEALDDIKAHQLAVLAGMQVALSTVVARFDPSKLEKRLEQSSLLEAVLPAARKARYWELFKQLYKEIAAELEDDFQKTFGAEFARAYSEQIGRL
jgi:type VI secretion system protein